MQINLTQALALAMQTTLIVGNVDANHDGKVSGAEIAAACATEIQAAAMTVPDIARAIHADPAKLQLAAAKFAEGIQVLVS